MRWVLFCILVGALAACGVGPDLRIAAADDPIGEIDAIVGFPVADAWQRPDARDGADLAAPVAWQLSLVGLAAVLPLAGSLIAFRQRQ